MNKKLLGAVVATAVAGLVLTGSIAKAADTTTAPAAAKVKCSGANACKGKGECKGAGNECKGKNACKGKGVMMMDTDKACTDAGGTVVAATESK